MRFISKFLNEKIQSMMDKIVGEQANLIAKGVLADDAWVIALANSPFCDCLDLYFRLERPVWSSEKIDALKIAVRIAKGTYEIAPIEKIPDNSEKEKWKQQLESQKERSQKEIQTLQELLKETQRDLQKEKDVTAQLRNEKD